MPTIDWRGSLCFKAAISAVFCIDLRKAREILLQFTENLNGDDLTALQERDKHAPMT